MISWDWVGTPTKIKNPMLMMPRSIKTCNKLTKAMSRTEPLWNWTDNLMHNRSVSPSLISSHHRHSKNKRSQTRGFQRQIRFCLVNVLRPSEFYRSRQMRVWWCSVLKSVISLRSPICCLVNNYSIMICRHKKYFNIPRKF